MPTLASLNLVLTANTAGFTGMLQKAERGVESLTSSVRALGGALLASGVGVLVAAGAAAVGAGVGLVVLTEKSLEVIDANAKLSDRLGIATESLIGLQHAAGLSGVESDALTGGLEKMLKVLGEAKGGSKSAADALAGVGLSIKDLNGLSSDDAFGKIADGLMAIRDPAERAAAATGIFGKSGQGLIPLLAGGAEGLRAMQREAEKLGLTYSRIDAAKVELANDAMSKIGDVLTGVGNRIAIELAPALEWASDQLVAFATQGEGLGPKVSAAFEWVAKAIAATADYATLLKASFHLFASTALSVTADVVGGVDGLGSSIAKLLNMLPGVRVEWVSTFSAMEQSLRSMANAQGMKAAGTFADFATGANGAKVSAFFAKIKADAQAAAEAIARNAAAINTTPIDFGLGKLKSLAGEGAKVGAKFWEGFQKSAEQNWQQLKSDAESVVEATRTPLEQLEKERAKLERLKGLGLLDDDTFARAMADAAQKASDALGFGGQAKGVEAMERRSGFTFVAQPEVADPLKAIADSSKGTEAAAAKQARLLEELVRRARNGEVISLSTLLGQAT